MSSCCNVTKAWTKTHGRWQGGNHGLFVCFFVPWLFPYQSREMLRNPRGNWGKRGKPMDFSQSDVWLGNVGKISRKLRRNLTQNPWVLTSLKVDITIFFEQGDATPTHPRKCNSHLSYHLLCFCAKPLAADDIRAGWSFVKTGIGSWWIMFLIKNHISSQMSSNLCFGFK